jgi:hypothetical protein
VGIYYVITKKGMKRAAADVGCMFVAYNLRRLIKIIDKTAIQKVPAGTCLLFCAK